MAERIVNRSQLLLWDKLRLLHEQVVRDISNAEQREAAAEEGLEYYFKSLQGQSLRFKSRAAILYFSGNPEPHPQPKPIDIPPDFYVVGEVGRKYKINQQLVRTLSLCPEPGQVSDIDCYVAPIYEVEPATVAEVRQTQKAHTATEQ